LTKVEISEADLAAAEQVAKAEGNRGLYVPAGAPPVASVERWALPFGFNIELTDGSRYQVLVVDGHVVTRRSLGALESYFRRVSLLDRRDFTMENVLGLLERWGQAPPGFTYIDPGHRGPHAEDVPRLEWGKREIVIVVYAPWNPPEGPGRARRAFETTVRATMKIDRTYELRWAVERMDVPPGEKWEPFER
jgi:hypothetical protein